MADKNNKDINGQPSGAQALGNYSSKLESVANQLEEAAKSFKTNTDEYKKTTNNLTQTLREFAKAFGKEMKENTDYSSKQTQGNNQDLSKAYERFTRGQEDNLTKGQKIGGALIKTAQTAFTFVFDKFQRSFNKVLDNYTSNLEAITSRMQKSNAEYSQMMYRATDWIKNGDWDLRRQFSQIDFSNALLPVLETGIRDGLAEEMAHRNMITNRILPMINTNTRAYTRMSKIFGETFTAGINAIGTYTSAYLKSAEGLEEGGYDTAIQTIYREVQEQVRLSGGGSSDVTSRMENILGEFSNLSSLLGRDTSEKILADYAAFVRGESVMQGDLESLLPGINSKSASFTDYWQAMKSLVTNNMSGMPSAYASVGFGFDTTLIQDVLNSLYFANKEQMIDTETMMKGYSRSAENQKIMDNLTKGYYQSITDQMDNLTENATAKLATWVGENIPYATEAISGIWGLLKLWLPILASSNATGGSVGKFLGGGNLSNLLISAGTETTGGQAWSSALGKLTGKGVTKGVATAGGALSTLAPIAGAGFAIGDMISGWSSGGISGALEKGLLGATIDEYTQMSQEGNAWGLVGTVAKNTGKGALLGAKAGPWGAVIGGAVGLVGSLTTALVEYNKEENVHLRNIQKNNEIIKENREALEGYNRALSENKTANDALKIVQDKNKIGTQEYKSALSQLQTQYPEYLGYMDEDYVVTDAQIKLLEKQIAAKEKDAELEWLKKDPVSGESLATEYTKGLENTAELGKVQDAYKYVLNNYDRLSDIVNNPSKYGELTNEDRQALGYVAKDRGGNWSAVESNPEGTSAILFLNQWEDIKQRGYVQSYDTSGITSGSSGFYGYLEDLNFWASQDDLFRMSNMSKALNDLKELDTFLSKIPQEEKSSFIEQAKQITSKIYKDTDSSSFKDYLISRGVSSDYEYLPQFKTGIGRVRANKMLAWIHDNEAVLPSSAADDLRQLAGTDSIAGMSNFLSALASIQNGRSVATPLTDSSMLSGLTNAIDSQTRTLSSILEAILDRVLIISNVIEDTQRRTSLSSTIPQSVLSYESVPLNA